MQWHAQQPDTSLCETTGNIKSQPQPGSPTSQHQIIFGNSSLQEDCSGPHIMAVVHLGTTAVTANCRQTAADPQQ